MSLLVEVCSASGAPCEAGRMSEIFSRTAHPDPGVRGVPPQAGDITHLDPGAPFYARFNANLAVRVTRGVGTMWCAYAFAALAFVSLPSAIRSGSAVTVVSWISQTFLQLVLLSIIMVGQNVLAAAGDKRAVATYEDTDALLDSSIRVQQHLQAQDAAIEQILTEVRLLKHA